MTFNPKIFEKITDSFSSEELNLKVSLLIVSKTNPRLKKINLDHLSLEKRSAKLHQWAATDRFVAVIEVGDQLFAHTHSKFASELLIQNNLLYDGKKVSVVALNDEEAKQLSLIGEVFEENLKTDDSLKKIDDSLPPIEIRQYFAKNCLISDQMSQRFIIARLSSLPSTIVLACLKRLNEEQIEEKRKAAAEQKHFDIKRSEIKKIIIKDEIKQQEIKILNQ